MEKINPDRYINEAEMRFGNKPDAERLRVYRDLLYDANLHFSGDDLRFVQGYLCDKIIEMEERTEHPPEKLIMKE